MLLDRLDLTTAQIERLTGWEIKPEGACRDDVCVPLAGIDADPVGRIDMRAFAERMDMPLVGDDRHGLWALGPRAGGQVLASTQLPDIVLDDFAGNAFDVATLRGRKVLLLAWGSY